MAHIQKPARRCLVAEAVTDFLDKKIKRARPGPSGDLRSLFGALAKGRAKGHLRLEHLFEGLNPDELEAAMRKMSRMLEKMSRVRLNTPGRSACTVLSIQTLFVGSNSKNAEVPYVSTRFR